METLLQQLTHGKALLLIIVLGFGGSFHNGYHITGLSSPSPYIQHFINSSWYDRYEEPPPPQMITTIWSLIVSMFAVGGVFGALSIRFVADMLGRKKAMICNSFISIAAAGIVLASKHAKSYEMIIVARLLFGFSAGLGRSTHLMYLAEISPRKLRGAVTLTSATFSSLGKLSGQFFGLSEILGREDLWNILLCVPAFFSVVQVIVLPFLPEAPRYLFIEKGDEKACKKDFAVFGLFLGVSLWAAVYRPQAMQPTGTKLELIDVEQQLLLLNALHRRKERGCLDKMSLWGKGDYKEEMDEMLAEQAAIEAIPRKSPLQLLRDRHVRWQLMSLCVIYLCNNLSGMFAINTFSFDIFLKTGIPRDKIRYVTLGLGVCEIITSITCGLLIECTGRRLLFWGGYGVMSACWVIVTVTLNLKDSSYWVPYISASLFILFIFFYCGGPGGASTTLSSEIFIQSNRTAAMVLVGIQRWVMFTMLGLVFPFLINSLNLYCFVLFAVVCLLGCLYTFFLLPETKGKTLLAISEEFRAITVCGKSFFEEKKTETKL